MQPEHLKNLVETGNYRPKPALIADAMLRRRGVRELLSEQRHEPISLSAAGRNRQGAASGPRAA